MNETCTIFLKIKLKRDSHKNYYVYILTNKRNGTLYTGINNNLLRRIVEHKRKINKGFTEKYNVNKIVWYEQINDVRIAIQREKQIKRWLRMEIRID